MNYFRQFFLVLSGALTLAPAFAHESRPAFLELREGEADQWTMTWKVPARGPDARLSLDVRLPEDCQWTEFPSREFTGDAFIDRGRFTREGGLDDQEVYIEGLRSTLTDAMVQVHRLDGSIQSARLEPAAPSFVVEAKPDPGELARIQFQSGLIYLATGWDHWLFLIGLFVLSGTLRRFAVAFAATLLTTLLGTTLVASSSLPVSTAWSELMMALGLLAIALAIFLPFQRAGKPIAAPPSGYTATAYGAVIGLIQGFACASGFSSAGTGEEALTGFLPYLLAIGVGLTTLALTVAVLELAIAALRKKVSSEPVPARSQPLLRLTAYTLGILGVFLLIDRW